MANTKINTDVINDNAITTSKIANDAITNDKIAPNAVGASEIVDKVIGASKLNVVGNGTNSQFLRSDGDGSFSWDTPASIGVGQSWSNLTSSRAFNTTYTNSTGKPIMVMVSPIQTQNVVCQGTVIVNGATIGGWYFYDNASGPARFPTSFIVPNGHTYRLTVTGSTLWYWGELR